MAITTLDGYIASAKQIISFHKTSTLTTVAAMFGDPIAQGGNPGAGVLAGTSTAAGVVPTDATAGFPTINAFAGGAKGYLSRVNFSSNIACRIRIVDLLFKAGAYAYNANTALTGQPSYASRAPNFYNTELWVEAVTAFTGSQSINITYTNAEGVTGRSTGTFASGIAPIIGRMYQVPLASTDSGIQKVENVLSTVSTVGTFNVLVIRPLWEGNIRMANGGDLHDFLKTGMPEVFADSALMMMIAADGTNTGLPLVIAEVCNG